MDPLLSNLVPELPVTLGFAGPMADQVEMELDDGGKVKLTPTQARSLAADLFAMADEAES